MILGGVPALLVIAALVTLNTKILTVELFLKPDDN